MTPADLERVVLNAIVDLLSDRIVERLRARQASSWNVPSRHALVLFTGTDLGLVKAAASLRELAAEGWRLRAALSPQARRLLTPALSRDAGLCRLLDGAPVDADGEALLDGCGLLLVPTLTATTAAKVACGLRDGLAPWLLARGIERGLRVVAAVDGCCPDNPARAGRGFTAPEPYREMMRAHLRALRSFGVELVPAGALALAVRQTSGGAPARQPVAETPAHGRRVFGRSDAALWRDAELRLGRDVLVTPAAADELRRRDIRLVQA
ncbi:flavoprotein [Azospirillum sp. TSO35-2]|uniref:flavoprotein n=1 Tax=Azospirillum sp. TSO35-2 TaxID=716796 RepID=UPI000D612E5F|nr:flavoprotein [Azospirillum sp. TSO35-2]PWC32870.1 hypothetical protein TSO352_19930 [Azospirillum sp. TSO35-2]